MRNQSKIAEFLSSTEIPSELELENNTAMQSENGANVDLNDRENNKNPYNNASVSVGAVDVEYEGVGKVTENERGTVENQIENGVADGVADGIADGKPIEVEAIEIRVGATFPAIAEGNRNNVPSVSSDNDTNYIETVVTDLPIGTVTTISTSAVSRREIDVSVFASKASYWLTDENSDSLVETDEKTKRKLRVSWFVSWSLQY